MIVVRDVLKLKIGKAKEAKVLWKEAEKIGKKHGMPTGRALVDLVGPYYTFVWEVTFKNVAEWEATMSSTTGAEEFGQWYQKFGALLESGGHREIFTVVE